MSAQNRALALRWFEEVWNQRKEETIDELLAASAIGHIEGDDAASPKDFKAFRATFLSALPDLRIDVEDTVVEGDNVVIRWRLTGTHGGDGLGFGPTQSRVDQRGMTWQRFADGQIVEGWDTWNAGGLITALRAAAHVDR